MLVCLACVVYLALGAFLVWYEWFPNLFGHLTLSWMLALAPIMPIRLAIRLAILVFAFMFCWLDEAEFRVYSHLRDRGDGVRR